MFCESPYLGCIGINPKKLLNINDFFPLDITVREESDSDQVQSDDADAETSPTKSPTTPKTVKCKTSSGGVHFVFDFLTSHTSYLLYLHI